jgi:pseudouridine-5'-phosphate glycosidase
MKPEPILVRDDVADALRLGRPVVALESTLIAHGLPWPANLETARESEARVRESGPVAATIAVVGGVIRVGLDDGELEAIARSSDFLKASRRDLAMVVSTRRNAATTVSATLRIARSVGIDVMATGGLGGVHLGASETRDVSTDLDELGRADGVLVVCSGVKSILDIPATLEALETLGVAVVGYRTGEFPAFTTPSSGLPVEWRADSPTEAASMVRQHRRLGLPGAIVLAQAVDPGVGIPREAMDLAIALAMTQAESRGITGKAITPFLLDAIRQSTGGRSLDANRALIVANAGLAAAVAIDLIDHPNATGTRS